MNKFLIGKIIWFFQSVIFYKFVFLVKKKEFVDFQPFCLSMLYLEKKFYGKLLYAILNQKELGELLHCFCNENQKNVVIMTIMIIAYIAKN